MAQTKGKPANYADAVEMALRDQRVINLHGVVDSNLHHELSMRLGYLLTLPPKKPITVYLNTPGGAIVDGLAMFDLIRRANQTHEVNVVATGACMSMGVIVLQAGAKRAATPNAYFLLHELHTVQSGSLGQLKDSQQHAEKLQNHLNSLLAQRTGLSEKKLEKLFSRKDLYLNAEEALELGLIDEIREA